MDFKLYKESNVFDMSGDNILLDIEKETFPFSNKEVDNYDYFLTVPNAIDIVKLAQRFTLKDGKEYAKIIPIPYTTLKSLIKENEVK